ncbi:2-oxo-4-hydroxy-4-carboxy-5-ureidoimidazoline decarboxylase [Vibrio hepatarius]|uniref:2-oxo-4-hydroxy-4-carboxy-5-ureidoimidazoline decarboxylase n=1 Tax=Vibrio hepatarius TaxID=171383 RepID=UPI001C09A962|nr:2-oxo-4-hydroxy-4-carboxy-5-ureidoimidazoline decarboxylase [Vibrio hepatarius]MBU2896630.1 2-oxo-4-hydroxy-4-carboxy-5-ureidoimidazoline decarboxylase [Vibrio hepatarius]
MRQFSTCAPCDMTREEFINQFGEVYEHSPWVAEKVFEQGLGEKDNEVEFLHQRMAKVLIEAEKHQQLDVLCAHPDLAGRAAISGDLSVSSLAEQAGAGLSQCTIEEFEQFTFYNDLYKSRFNFPFIMAVKGATRKQILDAFNNRIDNDVKTEFVFALEEVNKIALIRLINM